MPRDFAWLAAGLHAALFVATTFLQLLPLLIGSETLRNHYARASVWIPLLFHAGAAGLLAATLAWSHARNALEERGAASLARILNPGSRFALAYLGVLVLQAFVLSPLLFRLEMRFMPDGSLEALFGVVSVRSRMVTAMLIQSIVHAVMLVAGVWFAAWFALRKGGRTVQASELVDIPGNSDVVASPRRAIAFVGAAVFVWLQLWIGSMALRWSDAHAGLDAAPLLLGWVAIALLAGALAFWGAWLGAASQAARAEAHPFRAVAAAALAFVLLQLTCIGIAVGWMLWITRDVGLPGGSKMLDYILALAAIYLVLLVMLMRGVTRWLYRRYL
ncbi:hypothetical protein [Variovorax boronicumulans]|uniref:hypothetical protein n=1 Tax=Variovorax boronicumulans TaxID=436515 RepID=UPI0024736A62|nr:hypothetical protein [Variovorax boronicumulans]